jgi:GT2 family glycosyltransferase
LLTEQIYEKNESIIFIDGFTLEGPLLHRNMIEKAGFVEKKFFIYADDTEYSIRLFKNNIKLGIVKEAFVNRLLPSPTL